MGKCDTFVTTFTCDHKYERVFAGLDDARKGLFAARQQQVGSDDAPGGEGEVR